MIGAVVGLFNRLYLDASAQTAVEDYGLAAARLLHTPIISGLAAVGAVLIIPMLSALVNSGTAPAGNSSATSPAGSLPINTPAVIDLFNVDKRPFGLVLAAIFGLSPATLISRLQQESEKFKVGLKSSEAPSRQP